MSTSNPQKSGYVQHLGDEGEVGEVGEYFGDMWAGAANHISAETQQR